jgi:hypothetical protein
MQSFAIPGPIVLSFLAGTLFGWFNGVLVVCFVIFNPDVILIPPLVRFSWICYLLWTLSHSWEILCPSKISKTAYKIP